jgi:hypothetical protein
MPLEFIHVFIQSDLERSYFFRPSTEGENIIPIDCNTLASEKSPPV